MALGLNKQRALHRKRRRWVFFKWLLGLMLIAGGLAYAFESGRTLGERETDDLRRQISVLSSNLERLRAANDAMSRELTDANARLAEWQRSYGSDVPVSAVSELLAIARQKLAAGVDQDRLASVLEGASNTRDCDGEPVQRRFIVTTPLSRGPLQTVTFAAGLITISAEGVTARNELGQREAWFDPDQPITLTFTEISGRTSQATGRLPLTASLVVGNREHRFGVVAGTRGFIQVAGDSCAYP